MVLKFRASLVQPLNVLGFLQGLDHSSAANYLMVYWGGAMLGRFLGSFVMTKIVPNQLFGIQCYSSNSVDHCYNGGKGNPNIAMWALLAIGFFNSIMFPTIFSLATKGLGRFTSKASGVLCTAIVGGAFVPLAHGWVADTYNLLVSFVVSVICYAYIVFFAIKGSKADE